ncbi:uncharacterized protein LOC117172464 isoform X1 [Belonocnema kinseyi]|uniref:uncharacterized protein LOC117172464 isoform X1 n=1 Tax=Belonocnema kinseyi TaxID=2817044 RepID=UPI00143D33AB|nr:uncharacterized protein LOC117172464 isoform X1 [Belonocnema kinseyi]XP_033216311.1 uncharacterized protein LOC117172464 isoform X1 [Belonocnema kinseyi]XP_033216312.1 uncharacterized protein LOC117172464 isoform X1 [Belonocnema kinseyi]
MDFKFEINLQKICLVKVASSLWENKDVKQKIELFLQKTYKNSEIVEEQNILHWNKLLKDVLSHINNLPLPNKFSNKLRHITRSMGLKIYSWIKYITKVLFLDSVCIEDLSWTQYGSLDKIKIFKNWVEKKRLETTQLFNIACFFYLKDSVPSLWSEIPEIVRKNEFYSNFIYKMEKFSHIAYWKNILEDNTNKYFETSAVKVKEEIGEASRNLPVVGNTEGFESYHLSFLLGMFVSRNPYADGFEENMFELSLIKGQEFAVQYFWNRLDDEFGKRILNYVRYLYRKQFLPEYTDTIIFLVTKMLMRESFEFSMEESFGLSVLLSNHPWDEFFLPLLDKICELYPPLVYYGDEYRFDFLRLFDRIVELMHHEFELNGTVENSVYQNFFLETWKRIPDWAKFLDDDSWNVKFNEILSKLLLIEDTESLKFIINGEEFHGERCARLNNVLWAYLGNSRIFLILTDRQIVLLSRLLDEIELEEEERSRLKATYCKSCLFRF